MICYKCNMDIEIIRPSRNETCPQCSAYLKCCLNCRFYDPGSHNECRETQAEWVKDKEMANFCDFFEAGSQGKTGSSSRKEDSLKKLNDLFKKGGT